MRILKRVLGGLVFLWFTAGLVYWIASGRVTALPSYENVPTIAAMLMMFTFAAMGLHAALRKGRDAPPDDKSAA